MNRIAKIVALLVVLIAVFSFSQESSSACDAMHKVNSDSIALKALKDIQSSYELFLTFVGIIVAIVCAVLAFFGGVNWYENRINKNILNKIRNKVKKEKKRLKKNCRKLYGEIEYTYFSLAIASFKEGSDNKEHFKRLAEHFYILRKHKLKAENIDLSRLEKFDKWIEHYNNIEPAKVFLHELNKFIEYGEKIYPNNANAEAMYLGNIKEIWEKLCNKFGGQDTVLKAIKNFTY